MRRVRTILLVFVVVVVLLPATIYSVAYFAANSSLSAAIVRDRLMAALPQAAFSLSAIDIQPTPLGVHLHDLRLGDKEGGQVFELEHVAVSMDPFADELHLRQVLLEGLDLRVRVAEDGTVNVGRVLVPAEKPEAPEEPPGPPRPLVLDDLRIARTNFTIETPKWSLEIRGLGCNGHARMAPERDIDLRCTIEGGALRPGGVAAGDEEVVITPGSVGHVVAKGNEIRVDEVRFAAGGQELEATLDLRLPTANAPEGALPHVNAKVKGAVAGRVLSVLSGGDVTGPLPIDYVATVDDERVLLRLRGLNVQSAGANDTKITDLQVGELAWELAGGRASSRLQNLRVGSFTAPKTKLTGLELGLESTLSYGDIPLAELLGKLQNMGPASLPDEVSFSITTARLEKLVSDEVSITGAEIAEGTVEMKNLSKVMLMQLGELSADFSLSGLRAALVRVGDAEFKGLQGEAAVTLRNQNLTIKEMHATAEGMGQVEIAGGGKLALKAFQPSLPFEGRTTFRAFASNRIVAALAADDTASPLAALVDGTVDGELDFALDLAKPEEPVTKSVAVRVERADDVVRFSLAEEGLDPPPAGAALAFDPASQRIRVGHVTLSYRLEPKAHTP